ncbi:MAG: HD domain-containing protein [Lachnospiraceae bacterium]|nr:HD domain-containing protein [Lachnospiraceae bacterium]
MIDRIAAKQAFMDYTAEYNPEDPLIQTKIVHTMRVTENADRIAESIGFTGDDRDLAWLLGLLHDFGRFEQVRRFGTYIDHQSTDHAELGADILFKDGKIRLFDAAGLRMADHPLLETAIRTHNKLKLPDGQDERTRVFEDIIRDADKADIFRVSYETPFSKRAGTSIDRFIEKNQASEECMEYIMKHQCIPRSIVGSVFEGHLSHVGLAFELVYNETRRIVIEQGYLKKLLEKTGEDVGRGFNERELEQLAQTREELIRCFGVSKKDL